MRINPVSFDYGKLLEDMPNTKVDVLRKNVVIDNEIFGMWGENIDEENKIMSLKSISIKREHTKSTKEDIVDLWESSLNQYFVEDQPEEIIAKVEAKARKEEERKKKAEEAAKKAEEKAKAAASKAKTVQSNKSKDKKEQTA